MSITATPTPGKGLLSPTNHALVLIDFQSQMAFATKSIAPELLRNNAALVSNAAAGFHVPTILTTVAEKSFSGPMFSEITEAFGGQPMLAAPALQRPGGAISGQQPGVEIGQHGGAVGARGPEQQQRRERKREPCP